MQLGRVGWRWLFLTPFPGVGPPDRAHRLVGPTAVKSGVKALRGRSEKERLDQGRGRRWPTVVN